MQKNDEKYDRAQYGGYTSCPAFTGDKQLMLMEFKYNGVPDETFTTS